jgi:biopolymer transport protein ExbB
MKNTSWRAVAAGAMLVLIALIILSSGARAQETKAAGAQGESVMVSQNEGSPANTELSGVRDSRRESRALYYTVKKGGPIMLPIILCGIIGLTLIIERLLFFTRQKVWKSASLEAYLREVAAGSTARFREELADELRESFQRYLNRMERGLAFLQGIGNIAPLLGFLGTVTGMITAFSAIAAATTVNARIVAVGIQEALITTAGGFSYPLQRRFSIIYFCMWFSSVSGRLRR